MFNTVAKYLWGDNSECVQTDNSLEQQHANEENLDTHQEEDWVVVKAADKENNGHLANHAHRSQHACHHHHVQTHHSQSLFFGGHDSLSQNSSVASEAELLDDANALAQSVFTIDHCLPPADTDTVTDSLICPLHDYGWVNQDVDKYSDTDSLPESVFSACSGQSHATYHPCGSHSEPWVVAPPPCFTGSQVGGMLPLASSPLENLLIEHPSMSVYHSFPSCHPILSNHLSGVVDPAIMDSCHRKPCTVQCIDKMTDGTPVGRRSNTRETSPLQAASDEIFSSFDQTETSNNALQQRNRHVHVAVHPVQMLPHELFKNACMAQRMQCIEANKLINRNKCECQNKVREYKGHAKGNNRRNKRMHPSGFKSSRFSQHM